MFGVVGRSVVGLGKEKGLVGCAVMPDVDGSEKAQLGFPRNAGVYSLA